MKRKRQKKGSSPASVVNSNLKWQKSLQDQQFGPTNNFLKDLQDIHIRKVVLNHKIISEKRFFLKCKYYIMIFKKSKGERFTFKKIFHDYDSKF